jgi:hypothetical protein
MGDLYNRLGLNGYIEAGDVWPRAHRAPKGERLLTERRTALDSTANCGPVAATVESVSNVLAHREPGKDPETIQSVGLAAAVPPDEEGDAAERESSVLKALEGGQPNLVKDRGLHAMNVTN